MEKGQGKGTDTLKKDNDFVRRGDVKCLLENTVCLHEELPAQIDIIPAADVVPVVRCGECKHFNDDDGDCRCVKDAEWDEETATWYGFVSYHIPDFFCADGERKDGDGDV